MKKTTLFLLLLSAAMALNGCKGKEKETEPPTTEAPTEPQTVATEPPTTEPPTTEARESSMDRTRELKGLVLSSGTDTLTIQTERGKQLEFSTTGADIQLANGVQTGSNVTILYKGTISGTDTSGARVLMIVDLAAGETPVTEGELMTEAETADPEAGSGTIGGTVEDLNTDRIVITADDGESYYFSMEGAQVNLVNGLQQGNYVTIGYTGDIYGPDLVPASSISDNDPAAGDETVKAGPSADGGYSYISGTLTDCGMTTVTITTDEGIDLTFDTTKATHCYTNGIVAGNYITLEYTGTLNDTDTTGVEVVAAYDYTEEGGAPEASGNGSQEGADTPQTEAPADNAGENADEAV